MSTLTAQELGETADEYFDLRNRRIEKEHEAAELAKEENRVKDLLITQMTHSGITSIGGKLVKYELKKVDEPTVEEGNWEPVWEWLRETGEFDIMYRRLNAKALKDRRENDVHVPGVTWFPVYKLSQSKVK